MIYIGGWPNANNFNYSATGYQTQWAIAATAPSAGTITALTLSMFSGPCSCKFVIWDGVTGAIIYQSPVWYPNDSGPVAPYDRTRSVSIPLTNGQQILIGLWGSGFAGQGTLGGVSGGSMRVKSGGATITDMTGASYASYTPRFFATFVPGGDVKVRRSGAWVSAPANVRRSGIWVPASQVAVRRSGAWVDV